MINLFTKVSIYIYIFIIFCKSSYNNKYKIIYINSNN